MSRLVGWVGPRVKSPVPEGKLANPQEDKEPKDKGCPEHQTAKFFSGRLVTQHLQSQGQSCGPEVGGPWRHSTPQMASLSSIGYLEAGLLYPRECMVKELYCCYVHLYGPGVQDLLRWAANSTIVSFVPGTAISLKVWQKPW